ncbi:sugar transferase [uncultured Pontibacter sp.]|uniref:sugar transferase n=1 Tax=uncultured Pontibacter sp. TaxID=453356 RepID=UPI00262C6696|nr:sugar transferase [uncultured Pontibacter sp.]
MKWFYRNFFKRAFDLIFSLLAFLLLLPIFILVTLLLFIVNEGQPFFLQLRPGQNGKVFKIIKFKTMNDKKDSQGELLSDEHRLTAVGKFVRKTSLDEIPQLLNVIIGDMSIVGPRPLLVEYLPLYNKTQRRRHEVKPGITGWVGVNGRNAIGWDQKFNLDIWYVDNMSLMLDLRIIFLTVLKVFKSEGITAEGVATMPKFKGNN